MQLKICFFVGNHYVASLVAVYVLLTGVSEIFLGLLLITSDRMADVVEAFSMSITGFLVLYVSKNSMRVIAAFFLFPGAKKRSLLHTIGFLTMFSSIILCNLILLYIVLLAVVRSPSTTRMPLIMHLNATMPLNSAGVQHRALSQKHMTNQRSFTTRTNMRWPYVVPNGEPVLNSTDFRVEDSTLTNNSVINLDVQRNYDNQLRLALKAGTWKLHALNLFALSVGDIMCVLSVGVYLHGLRVGLFYLDSPNSALKYVDSSRSSHHPAIVDITNEKSSSEELDSEIVPPDPKKSRRGSRFDTEETTHLV